MPEENPRRRHSQTTFIIGFIVIVVLAAGGVYAWKTFGSPQEEPTPTPETPTPPVEQTVSYASSTMKISVTYPQNFTVDDMYANTSVSPTKPILGVKFTVPLQMATGTNLAADSGISIEQLPRAKNCTGDIYLAANVSAREVVEGTATYSFASSTDAGAGNLYEEMIYAIKGSSPCTAVRYFIHSTQISNYPPGSAREFDRTALLAAFDAIRRSVVIAP